MKSRGAILAAALIAGLVFLWWLLRSGDADANATEPDPGESLPDDLTSLPNYHPARDSRTSFATHEEFVKRLDQAFIARFPGKPARALLIAHAATAGWHLPKRPPLYHWNLWGQLCTKEQIRAGVAFTLLKPNVPDAKYHPFRAFSSPEEALFDGYIPNINKYGTGALTYLDTRTEMNKAVCVKYATLIKPWFAVKERTPAQLDIKGGKWLWIINKFCAGKLL
jgi:hypothetical protein